MLELSVSFAPNMRHVVASCVPPPEAHPTPPDQEWGRPAHHWRGCELRAGPFLPIAANCANAGGTPLFYDAQLDIKAMDALGRLR